MKRSWIKRKPTKPLKRTKLRKKSLQPMPTLRRKADRALQDWFRREYPDNKCECCGGQYEVMHHHILKSNSNAARFNHDNLIFLCSKCHSSLHFGNLNLISIYTAKRGNEWVEKMVELKKVKVSHYGKKALEVIIKKYA